MTMPTKDISATKAIGRLGVKIIQLFTVGIPALFTQLLKAAAAIATVLSTLVQVVMILAGCALLVILVFALV